MKEITCLSFLRCRPRLSLVLLDRMQHDLVRQVRRVGRVALAPVVRDGVGKDGASAIKGGGRDSTIHGGIPFETVLGVLVPT